MQLLKKIYIYDASANNSLLATSMRKCGLLNCIFFGNPPAPLKEFLNFSQNLPILLFITAVKSLPKPT